MQNILSRRAFQTAVTQERALPERRVMTYAILALSDGKDDGCSNVREH